jgi:NAD(P)-dependent dehydrogenase (short-subunit alcohol dehydrogenase family)
VATSDLSRKKCLITGAASGIGRATAVMAGRAGAELFLTDIQDAALDTVVAEITGAGGTVSYRRAADVADYEAISAMAAEVHAAHGSLDVVMNVAGISTWGSIERLEHDHWRRLIEVDLMGPIHVMECFLPPMIEAGRGGHLVNVSSAAGLLGLPWHAAYSAAKFGLRGVSEVLRFDLRRHGIGVTLVCPGGVNTPLVESVEIVGVDRNAPAARKLSEQFRRRAVTPEHVAAAILDGVRNDRYLVFTSNDIRILFWLQRTVPPLYRLAMRILNDRMVAVARQSGAPRAPTGR